jgi:hypothetical protein
MSDEAEKKVDDAERIIDEAARQASVAPPGKVLSTDEAVTASIQALERRVDKQATAIKLLVQAVRRQGFSIADLTDE